MAMERSSPPPPRLKPPRLPRRPVGLGVAAGKAPAGTDNFIPPRGPPAFRPNDEDSCLDLAKLMLSPEGLAMKKITLEGFSIPVVLRLLDRRRPQQEQQEQQQQRFFSTSNAAAALSITWVPQDTFGFDMRGLTTRRVEGCGGKGGVGRVAAGRKRGRGVGSGDDCCMPGVEAYGLVLAWSSMGCGSAEVVLEAASRQQRDLLAVTLETLVAGLGGEDSSARASGASGDIAEDGRDDGDGLRWHDERSGSCSSDADEAYTSDDDEAAAALMLAEFDRVASAAAAAVTGSRRTTLGPHETGVTPAAHSSDGDSELLFSPANGIASARRDDLSCSVTRRHQAHRKTAQQRSSSDSRPGLHRRGMSFSPGEAVPLGRVPVLARSRTAGAAGLGGGSEAALLQQQEEQEQDARVRREDAMARLLAVYDRARDESQAAAWRLGVRKNSAQWAAAGGGGGGQ